MTPKKWMISCFGVGVLVFCAFKPAAAQLDEATYYLEQSSSLSGSTGWINIPSPAVPDNGKMTGGLHRGSAEFNLGLLNVMEVGLYFEADRLGKQFDRYKNLSTWEEVEKNVPAFVKEAFKGQAKIKLLDQDWGLINLAVGMEKQDYYIVGHRHFPELSNVTLLAGWGRGRFEKGFFGLSKTIFSGADLIFEFDGQGFNVGYRLLLGPNLIMNLAGQDLNTIGEVQNLGQVISNHLIFGITYVERIW